MRKEAASPKVKPNRTHFGFLMNHGRLSENVAESRGRPDEREVTAFALQKWFDPLAGENF